jgi:hypothetical protein
VEIISLGFRTITWFLSSTALDICGIVSSSAIDLEKPIPKKDLGSTFDPYD